MSPKRLRWRIVPRQILTSLAQLIRIAEIPKWWSSTSRLFAFTALLAITIYVWILLALRLSRYGSPGWRLTYERITNLPSGLSSIFPLLFLSVATGAWIYSNLSRRRLYRLSYLPSASAAEKSEAGVTHFEEILINMRKTREEVDRLIATRHIPLADENVLLVWAICLFLLHIIIRSLVRGLPASLEGFRFDVLFWSLFLWVFLKILRRTLQLRALSLRHDREDASSRR